MLPIHKQKPIDRKVVEYPSGFILVPLVNDLDSPTAYVVRCACDPGADGSGGRTVVDHIRLFPLRDDIRWTYRVHEQILPALNGAGLRVRWSNVTVRHTGYTDPTLRAKKLVRDERLSCLDLKDRPEEPFVMFNLGAIAIERQEWRGALGYLTRSLARSVNGIALARPTCQIFTPGPLITPVPVLPNSVPQVIPGLAAAHCACPELPGME